MAFAKQAIRGIQWKCGTCKDDFSLCFKCYNHRSTVHNPKHEFDSVEPLYKQSTPSPVFSFRGDGSEDGENEQELPQDTPADHQEADNTASAGDAADAADSPRKGSPAESLDFDMDGSDEEE
jgi:nitric oxide reductase activation protein